MNRAQDKRSFIQRNGTDIIVISILVILTALIVEQTIRFYIFGFDSFSYEQMASIKSMGHSGFIQAADEKEIVYELKTNIDSRLKLVSFKTNSHGLRDKEYPITKPPSTFRVAVIGSSFTYGSGVEIEDTYHTLLEERLNAESQNLRYEFLNFGVGGYTTRNKLATMNYKVLNYDPDLVLFVLDGSQFTDDKFKEFVPKPTKNHFFTSYTYKLIAKNRIFKSKEKRGSEFTKNHLERLDELNETLRTLSKVSRTNDIPICVIVLDHDYLHLKLSNEIKKLTEKNNLCFANTIPSFKNKNFDDFVIYRIDFHPNVKAHEMFAESIYENLNSQSIFEEKTSAGVEK